ncbi:cobyrinate a,c-diamide synthase [Oleidesulfovibrio sp.]|uniref:cobyrinate a,c-diamide synthase n=1 Tax=Oleidesulfovibrio sp. TaxID=2909707 RepID=UPI003A8B8416
MSRIVTIAGTHSGCGKTTFTLGVMAALSRRGFVVQPYKSGPDFIDPGHHTHVTGRTCHNLDGWMMGRQPCINLARSGMLAHDAATCPATKTELRHTEADVGVLEGVMGLFDGASGAEETGSTAQIAKWLNAPVILVVDARSMARSAAALVSGYVRFDPALQFAGVVFNRVGSENHRSIISEAMHSACPEIPVLGFLPRNEKLSLPSRHLGLTTSDEAPISHELQHALADWVEQAIDLPALMDKINASPVLCPPVNSANRSQMAAASPPAPADTHCTPPAAAEPAGLSASKTRTSPVRIGVARDQAFCFTYAENLRLLRAAGAELVFFSPLHDSTLPSGLNGLYLGGGYPEVHAAALNINSKMRNDVYYFSASGGVIYAECGGFMYLMKQLRCSAGTASDMCGCLPFTCAMGTRFRALGYRQIRTTAPSVIGPEGTVARGHEFHYSHIYDMPDLSSQQVTTVYSLTDRKGSPVTTKNIPPAAPCTTPLPEGFSIRNTLGSYVHLHFASNPDVAHSLVASCRKSGITTC